MLIVSQDKETIINFDKVIAISTSEGKIGVSDNLRDVDFCLIGEYQTEERAKEVLEEIVKEYENVKAIFDCTTRRIKNYINKPKVYKMPEK